MTARLRPPASDPAKADLVDGKVPAEQLPAATGGGLGVDVWSYGGDNPAGVTDWGAIYNQLFDNGAKKFLWRDETFPFTTRPNLAVSMSVTWEGAGGAVFPSGGFSLPGISTRLMWKGGAGSGGFLELEAIDGFTARDLGICYDNPAYDGNLCEAVITGGALGGPALSLFDHVHFGTVATPALASARCLFRLQHCVNFEIRNSSFRGAQSAIRGVDTNLSPFADDHVLANNSFSACALAYIMNIGHYWTIRENVFNMGYGGADSPVVGAIVDYDLDVPWNSVFTFDKNQGWDYSPGAQFSLRQRPLNTWTMSARGNWWDTNDEVYYDLQGPGQVEIMSDIFGRVMTVAGPGLIDLGPASTAYKTSARITGNSWGASEQNTQPVRNIGGHGNVEITGNALPGLELRTHAGQERVMRGGPPPTVAPSAGAPAGLSVTLLGESNEVGGTIRIDIGSAVTTPTPGTPSKLVDVTFGRPLLPANTVRAPEYQMPSVVLTPCGIPETWPYVDSAARAGGYAIVSRSQQAGFSIAVTNAVGAGAVLFFTYRVITI